MKAVPLDTNAFSALFRGDEEVLKTISRAKHVFASVIVIGELEAGFRGGTRYRENVEILDRFLARPTVETLEVTPGLPHENTLINQLFFLSLAI